MLMEFFRLLIIKHFDACPPRPLPGPDQEVLSVQAVPALVLISPLFLCFNLSGIDLILSTCKWQHLEENL